MSGSYRILIVVSLGISLNPFQVFSQDNGRPDKEEKDNRPVDPPFESGYLLNGQTAVVPSAKTFEFMIQHRFGTLNNSTFDLVGLYAPSNIRLGLSYTPTDFLRIGIGTTKSNKLQDINWKWSILRQTRSGSIPVGLTYYGNVEFSAREKQNFGLEYEFTHRMSYFHQLIVSRRINRRLSAEALVHFSHFNQVDTISFPQLNHNNIAVAMNGRFRITPQLGLIFGYDHSLTTPSDIKPNAGLGIEISTLLHTFQVFVSSYSKISPQSNMSFNTNDFTKKDLLIGFNINRLWKF